MKIGIDFGHTLSGEGTGAVGLGYKEQDLTRSLGKEVVNYLEKEGHKVYNCTVDRASTNSLQLKGRVDKANKESLDLFVSIHFNACVNDTKGDGKTTGTEVLVYSLSGKSTEYAKRVCENISKLGFKNRGVKSSNAYVLKNTKAPAMLIETCFIDDKDDMDIYLRSSKLVAKAIAEGIIGKTIVETPQAPKNGFYRVLVGSYKEKDNALKKQEELKLKGVTSSLIYFDEI